MITHRFIDALAPAARLPWARAAAATLAAAVTLNGCSKDPAGAPDAAPEVHAEHSDEVTLRAEAITRYGITLGRASRVALQDSIPAPARVAFNTETMAHVSSPLRGRVVEAKIRVGDAVKEGQELLAIESPELGEAQADLLQRRTAAQTAAPTTELSKASWERAKGLYDRSQGIALAEVQRRVAEYHATLALQRAAEAAATAAENRLHLLGMSQEQVDAFLKSGQISARFTIRAPIAATVVEREVTMGELVGPDDSRRLWRERQSHEDHQSARQHVVQTFRTHHVRRPGNWRNVPSDHGGLDPERCQLFEKRRGDASATQDHHPLVVEARAGRNSPRRGAHPLG